MSRLLVLILQSHAEEEWLMTWSVSSSLRKLYVAVSVGVCLLFSSLVLFFLFPRSVLLSPVGVKSSLVYFIDDDVQINITVGREGEKTFWFMKNEMWKVWTDRLTSFWLFYVCFLVERPEHHQPELCDSAGLQPDSAGPEFSHGGGNSAD